MRNIHKTIAVCGDGLIADATAVALRDLAAVERLTAEMLPTPGAWDGLVVASDASNDADDPDDPDTGLRSAAHTVGQASGVPWMPIHAEPDTAVIGTR